MFFAHTHKTHDRGSAWFFFFWSRARRHQNLEPLHANHVCARASPLAASRSFSCCQSARPGHAPVTFPTTASAKVSPNNRFLFSTALADDRNKAGRGSLPVSGFHPETTAPFLLLSLFICPPVRGTAWMSPRVWLISAVLPRRGECTASWWRRTYIPPWSPRPTQPTRGDTREEEEEAGGPEAKSPRTE